MSHVVVVGEKNRERKSPSVGIAKNVDVEGHINVKALPGSCRRAYVFRWLRASDLNQEFAAAN